MTRFERWAVWVTSLVAGSTGIALGWMKYFMTTNEPWAIVNHPLQPLALKLHILSSPLLVFAVGLITLRHVWPHFKSKMPRGRRSGLMTAALIAPMVVTGYVIQAITHRGWLFAMAMAHIGTGLFYLAVLGLHQLAIRSGRRPAGIQLAGSPGEPPAPAPAPAPSQSPPSSSLREVTRSRA